MYYWLIVLYINFYLCKWEVIDDFFNYVKLSFKKYVIIVEKYLWEIFVLYFIVFIDGINKNKISVCFICLILF